MKYHIEKNTVQETLVIPLYGRKMCSELYPNLFRDETAMHLIEEIDYDFSTLAKRSQSMMQQFGFLECAMRQSDLACEVRDYLRSHPNAAVVNLGCGLDATGRACDNGTCKIYNLDFPDVIAVRDALLPALEREKKRDFRLAERHKRLLESGLERIGKSERKVHAQRPDGAFDQLLIRGKQVHDRMREQLHSCPDRKREHERRREIQLHDALHAVGPLRAAGVAEDGLRALRESGQRQLHHLRHRGQDGHRADGCVAAVLLQRYVERDGEQAFC